METEKNNQSEGAPESFDKIVQQSATELAQAQEKIETRGRKKGSKNKKGRENEPGNGSNKVDVEVLPNGRPPVDIKPAIKQATKVPFSIAAIKFDQDELEATDKDVETPAFYLNEFFNHTLPDIEKQDPKKFAILLFFITFGVLIINKILVGIQKKKQNSINQPLEREGDQTGNPGPRAPAPAKESLSPLPGSPARDVFGGRKQ